MDTQQHPGANLCPPLSRLERLPLLILELICQYLGGYKRRRRDLLAFVLTSKTCSQAANKERFSYINITLKDLNMLPSDIERWREILGICNRLHYVRMIKINSPAFNSSREEEGETEDEPEDSLIQGPTIRSGHYWSAVPWSENEKRSYNKLWQPLAQLCSATSLLQDLVWATWQQVPPCILSTLHDQHRSCRLHIFAFNIRSLAQSPRPGFEAHQLQAVHPDELTLASSPCLYRVIMSTSPYRNWSPDYNEEALLAMVGGLAPKLAHVHLLESVPPSASLVDSTRTFAPRHEWEGFPGLPLGPLESENLHSRSKEYSTGRLQSLILERCTKTHLDKWTSRTDFRVLHSLDLRGGLFQDALQQLTKLALEGSFESLDSLSFLTGEQEQQDRDACALLQALRPLKNLSLSGDHISQTTLELILDRHAETLINLRIAPHSRAFHHYLFSNRNAQHLVKKGLRLEQLELLVPRYQGKRHEVIIYEQLSRLPRLKYLSLYLGCYIPAHCHLYNIGNNGTRYTGQGSRARQMEDILRNAALDSALAMDIFRILTGTGNSLRTVKLQPCGSWGDPSPNEFDEYVVWIGRKWLIQKQHFPVGDIRIREINKRRRESALPAITTGVEYLYLSSLKGIKSLRIAWKRIWPSKSKQWWLTWSSLPLEREPAGPETPAGQ